MITDSVKALIELGVTGWPAILFLCLAAVVRRLWKKQDREARECANDRRELRASVDGLREDLDEEKDKRRDLEVDLVQAKSPCGLPSCPRLSKFNE